MIEPHLLILLYCWVKIDSSDPYSNIGFINALSVEIKVSINQKT